MRKKSSYADTLIYSKNEKIYNKSMSLSDNDNNYIIEDEVTRTKEWRSGILKRIKILESLKYPEDILKYEQDRYEKSLTMTYSEYLKEEEKENQLYYQEYLLRKQEYLKKHSPKQEIIDLILNKFDKWFEKYKDSESHMCDFNHRFREPFYWGEIVPFGGQDKEFYQQVLSTEDVEYGLYDQVFHYCENVVDERAKQKGWIED